ncbi:MAG: glycogen/starch synthase, partial [Pyramidobacter sp.]|nr:glycogen/starch synthase [Pyramidobacter sp.]
MRVLMLGWEFPPDKSGGLGTACYGITQALLRKGTDVLFIMPQTRLTEHPESHVRLRSASGTLIPVVSRSEPEAGRAMAAPDSHSQNGTRPRQNCSIAELQQFAARMVVRGIRSSLRPYDSAVRYEQRLGQRGANRRTKSAGGKGEIFRRLGLPQFDGSIQPADAAASPSQPQDAAVRWKPVEIHGGYGQDLMSEVYRYSLAAAQIAREEDFDVIHVHDWMTYPAGILIKQITGKPLITHIHALEHDRSGENVNP